MVHPPEWEVSPGTGGWVRVYVEVAVGLSMPLRHPPAGCDLAP